MESNGRKDKDIFATESGLSFIKTGLRSVPMRCNQYPPDQKLPFRDGIESDAKRNSSSPSTRNSCYLALTSTVAPRSLRHVYSEINTQEMGMFARSARDYP